MRFFHKKKRNRLITEGIMWNSSDVTEGLPAGCTTWKAIAAAAANQAVWGPGQRAGCEQWDSSNEMVGCASQGQLTGGIRDQRASDALKGLEDKMYYCDYFMCCTGSRELSASICSSHWKEERCSHTSVLIHHFFHAGCKVKITGYPCNIKRHKKKITLGKKRPVTSCVMLKRTHFLSPLGAEPVCKEQGKVCTCGYQKAIQVHHKPALPHTSQILWGSMYWDCHFLSWFGSWQLPN